MPKALAASYVQCGLARYAHPNFHESRLNKALIDAVHNEVHVKIHDLYALYQTAEAIDVTKEQELLLTHDRIVFQFPLYWFSTPVF